MSTFQSVFQIVCLSFVVVALAVTCYWLRGASLFNQAAAAYRAGDIKLAEELERRAKRWTVGA